MKSDTKKRIGILRGGEGKNYNSSLRDGGNFISHIFENLSDKYKTVDILVDSGGVWHINGLPIMPSQLVHKVDVVWNVAHPGLSLVLQNFSIPVVGDSSFSHALLNNRTLLEKHIKENLGINMPRHFVLPVFQEDFDARPTERSFGRGAVGNYAKKKAKEVFQKFSPPWIVRSLTPLQNMGIHLAKTLPELERAIEDGVNHKQSILIEEFILGKVASIHSVLGFRGQDTYTFPLEKNFTSPEKEKLINLVQALHNHLNTHPYLQSDFILTPKGKIYLTGILFTPNLKEGSHLSQVCESVGAKMHHIVEHILGQAL